MGNYFGPEEVHDRRTHPGPSIRSWADLTSRTTLESQATLRAIRNPARNQNNETHPIQTPKLKKPVRVKKLISIKPESIKISRDESELNYTLKFSYDAKGSATAIVSILCDEALKSAKFSRIEEKITQGTNVEVSIPILSTADLKGNPDLFLVPNINDTKSSIITPLVIRLIPDADQGSSSAQYETTSLVFIKKSETEVELKLLKQSIMFNNQEYTYKKWYGDEKPQNMQGNDPQSEASLCVVCLENEKSTVINPCLHKCLCTDCARMLSKSRSNCPLCRSPIAEFWVVSSKDVDS